MLASRIGSFEGLRVADLFAGSGALGLEALSRGAAHCIFVETDRAAINALRSNISALGADAQADVRAADATRLSGGPFDLVTADSPYDSGLGQRAVAHLADIEALAPGCLVSVEAGRREEMALPKLVQLAERTYGKARIWLFRA
jgi:16S rRNA (guanine966-N2)-methyltransferase